MMATRNTPPLWTRSLARLRSGFPIIGQALQLIALLGVLWAYVWIADAIINAPPPTERCFHAAAAEMGYCRSQRAWN